MTQSTFQPQSGMWCIQGTVSKKTDTGSEVTSQFATFYLHPEVNADSEQGAIRVATGILNPTNDPAITPNVSAVRVSVECVAEYSDEERKAFDDEDRRNWSDILGSMQKTDAELAS